MSAADVSTAPMLPSELNFALPPSIPAGWSTKTLRVQTISTYPNYVLQGNEFQIQVPQLPNTFLDPSTAYINVRAKFNMSSNLAMEIDNFAKCPVMFGSGWSMFQRYELYFNNQELLDQIMLPGVAVNAMSNITMNKYERTAASHLGYGAVSGAEPNYCCAFNESDGVRRTDTGAAGTSGAIVDRSVVIDFALPMIGVLGHATDKLIPMFLGGFRIDLTADAISQYLREGSVAAGTTLYIQNVEFVANTITVDAGSLGAIIQQHPESLFIRTQSWTHSSQALASGSNPGLYELLISSRVSSLKHLLICPSAADAYEGIYSGVNPELTNGTCVNINNIFFPQATHDPTLRPADFLASNRIAMNTLYCANHGGCVGKNQFLKCADKRAQYFSYNKSRPDLTASSPDINAFYWIQSTEVFGRKASLLSGVDTKSGANFLRLQVANALPTVFTFNMFACHDVILQCDLQTRRITRKI